MRSIRVKTESAEYRVFVQSGLLASLATHIRQACGEQHSIFVVTSPQIWALWGKSFLSSFPQKKMDVRVLFVPPGERYKRLATVERLAEELSRAGARRDALLVAFGGGVVGDMAGFLAAIYMRGIRYAQVPTTYLAQIDSSLGGKTGVNLRSGKNLLGSFHRPVAVFTDPALLATLPSRELRAGIVESVKAAVLGDESYFDWLESDLDKLLRGDEKSLTQTIEKSVRIKAEIVSADEHESGQRMLLNLGHTVGHAIEAATRYNTLLHGEAVAWGMMASVYLSMARSALPAAQGERIERLLFRLGPFPRFRSSAQALLERTASDKKHLQAVQRFVLPLAIGHAAVVEDVSQKELLAAIQSMLRLAKERGI
ncbi:MAG: 3-dehydroquinate synthase [Acidobacteriaceae bacterium]